MKVIILQQEDLIPLRSQVLRPGSPKDECYFQGDNNPGVVHLGVLSQDCILSICSLYPEKSPKLYAQTQYRLRGMATDPKYQKCGHGKMLIHAAIGHLKDLNVSTLWCNARTSAIGFYEKQGFKILGDEFEIPSVGPHFIAYLDL